MIWRDQHAFSSILYAGGTQLVFEGKVLKCEDTTSIGSLTLGYRAVAEVTEAQQQARAVYESLDKRGPLVWGNSVLFWRAQISAGKSWKCLELGDATRELETEFASHKLSLQGRFW